MSQQRDHGADGSTAPNAIAFETSSPRVFCKEVRDLDAPSRSQIRERAYFIYLARNGAGGDPNGDWLQAENELRAEIARRSGTPKRD